MKQNGISKIIRRFLSERFHSATEEKVQRWIIKERNTKEKKQASEEYWNELESKVDSRTYAAMERVNVKIGYSRRRSVPMYKKTTRIAAVLIPFLALATGGYFYYHSTKNTIVEVSVAYRDGRYLILPDSSKIWLNGGTTIRYPEKFKGKERLVYLDGEAYFSVTNDENKSFIVETGQLSVKVLGTQFNVRAYSKDGFIKTTLIQGKVAVRTNENNQPVILNPNESAFFVKESQEIYKEINKDALSDIAWKDGKFIFNNKSLLEITDNLENYFNIRIHIDNTTLENYKLTAHFEQGETLEDILNILQAAANFKWNKNGDTINIKSNN